MALNPSIILAGQTPDILGSMSRGASTADQLNQIKRGNALQNLYRSQGDQIAAGNENALAQLARFDPNAALGVQQTRLGMDAQRLNMDATRQTMARLDREERRQIEAAAAQMDAQQAQAAAAQMDAAVRELATYHQQGNRQAYMQAVQRLGLDPNAPEYQFDNFPALAARSGETIEILSTTREAMGIGSNEPQFRPATAEEAAQYGAQSGQIDTATGRFYANNPPSGMTVESTPDGGIRLVQGPGVGQSSSRPPTVDESKNAGFLDRAMQSNAILGQLDTQGASLLGRGLEVVPGGNFAQTPEYQQFEQARRDFVNAILRRESGAVISDAEFSNADRQYFPQPGDSPEVIEQKRQNRESAIRGLRIGSGSLADQVAPQEAQIPPAPTNVPGITPDNWPQVWEAMPPEDRELFK